MECNGRYKQATVILPFDMQDAHWEEVAQKGLSSFAQGVDLLIHTTGISQHSPAVETKASVVDEMFQVNTIGAIALTQALLPGLLRQQKKSQIVVVASMAAKIPSPGQAIYSASKSALLGYFLTLRTELASSGIGVSVCCPGPYVDQEGRQTRNVFGREGLMTEEVTRKDGVPSQLLVKMIALAAHYNIAECWIAKNPILLLAYIMQLAPRLGMFILESIGPQRAFKTATKDSYSLKSMFTKPKKRT